MVSALHGQPATFATVQRSRALLATFMERAGANDADRAPWIELSDTLAALENSATAARSASADWMAKAALARAEQRASLAETADRRAADAEQEFAAYLTEIAAIWAFLENGAQEPLTLPQTASALGQSTLGGHRPGESAPAGKLG